MPKQLIAAIIEYIEVALLLIIMLLTLGAVFLEIKTVLEEQHVELADLLLMFIYVEVIAMVAVFIRSQEIPVIYPIFIAITALSRLIILQNKELDAEKIYFEALSIFILSLSVVVLQSDFMKNVLNKFQSLARPSNMTDKKDGE